MIRVILIMVVLVAPLALSDTTRDRNRDRRGDGDNDNCAFDQKPDIICRNTCHIARSQRNTAIIGLLSSSGYLTIDESTRYDVHGYRACAGEGANITLDDLEDSAMLCTRNPERQITSTIQPIVEFESCGEFLKKDNGVNLDVYIFIPSDPAPRCDYDYRFLLVNTTTSTRLCQDLDCPTSSKCLIPDDAPCEVACSCDDGYREVTNSNGDLRECEDIDECVEGLCRNNSRCANSIGSFSCTCLGGYSRSETVRQECRNVNECEAGVDNCPSNRQCMDTDGSFICTCFPGYKEDEMSECNDVDECSIGVDDCPDESICSNTEGGFNCTCKLGYRFKDEERQECIDIDECVRGENCSDIPHSHCVNLPGGYECVCDEGFRNDGSDICKDVDECLEKTDFCDREADEVCKNKEGGYRCVCKEEYERSLEDGKCESCILKEIKNEGAELFSGPPSAASIARALEFVDGLVSVTGESEVSEEDLSLAADLLVNVTGFLTEFQSIGGSVMINESLVIVEVLDNVLTPSNISTESVVIGMSVLQSSENMGRFVLNGLEEQKLLVIKDNIMLEAVSLDTNQEQTDFHFPLNGTELLPPVSIVLPQQLLNEQLRKGRTVLNIAHLVVSNVDQFFPTTNESMRPISVVISSQVTMETTDTPILRKFPVILEFEIFEEMFNDTDISCVFLDTSNGVWSSEGVTTEMMENGRVRCVATHLTSFTVLLSSAQDVNTVNNKVLQIMTQVGLTLSLICLFVTIIFYISYGRVIFTQVHYFVHLNLSLSLFCAYIVFIFGDFAIGKEVPCRVVASLLNYFFLAVFCWMLCEAVMLYLMLVVVFSKLSKKWWFFLILGWGPPALIFAITYGTFNDKYIKEDLELCWLAIGDGYYTLYMFIGPAAIIVMINTVFLVLVVKSLCQNFQNKKILMKREREHNIVLSQVKASVILLPLIGLTWGFGFLVFNEETSFSFGVISIILNTLQGVFIFLLHVVRSDRVWGRIKKRFGLFTGEFKKTIPGVSTSERSSFNRHDSKKASERASERAKYYGASRGTLRNSIHTDETNLPPEQVECDGGHELLAHASVHDKSVDVESGIRIEPSSDFEEDVVVEQTLPTPELASPIIELATPTLESAPPTPVLTSAPPTPELPTPPTTPLKQATPLPKTPPSSPMHKDQTPPPSPVLSVETPPPSPVLRVETSPPPPVLVAEPPPPPPDPVEVQTPPSNNTPPKLVPVTVQYYRSNWSMHRK